jgi:hypothetical protein
MELDDYRRVTLTLLSEADLAVILEVEIKTVQAWRMQGRGPDYVKLGKSIYYRTRDLQEWIDANVNVVQRSR